MWEIFFFKNHAENEVVRLVPDLFLLSKKALHEAKQMVSTLFLIHFVSPRIGHTIKAYVVKFQKKVWGKFLQHILCIVFQENFFWFYILLTDQLLMLGNQAFYLFEILDKMYIIIISFLVDDVINFEVNLSFLIKPFSYMTEKVTTKI